LIADYEEENVRRIAIAILASIFILGWTGCTTAPTSPPTTVPPTATVTATAEPTSTPVPPTPTVTPTATPYPTPDPATLAETAKRGLARVQAAAEDANVVCLRYEDTDGDTEPEWLALTHQPEAGPRLSAFVLDGDAFYALPAAQPEPGNPDYGLGEYATCEIEVRDVNADGKPEVAIFGHAETNETLLHLYVWEREQYRLLGAFQGDAGVFFEDADGDLAEEIIEGHHDTSAPSLAWHVVFTWDGQTYGWTSDRWAWFYLDRPHTYPTHKPIYAVISFYLALDDRDLPSAYALLTETAQASRSYGDWANGYATTLRVNVGAVHQIPGVGDENNARVTTQILSWDNVNGRVIVRTWETIWATIRTAGGWRLSDGEMTLLDEWEAPYWR
jgi:hypothetical protein